MAPTRRDQDLWRHVFTATGGQTDPRHLTMVDVFDNLIVEAERLATLEELLSSNPDSELVSIHGLAFLLGDIRRRMQTVLEMAVMKEAFKERRTRRKK